MIPSIIEDYKDRIKDNTNNKVELIYANDAIIKNNNPIIVEAWIRILKPLDIKEIGIVGYKVYELVMKYTKVLFN